MSLIPSLKLKNRFGVALGIILVLITTLLIIDLQLDMSMSEGQLAMPLDKKMYDNENEIDQSGVLTALKQKFQFGDYAITKGTSTIPTDDQNEEYSATNQLTMISKDKYEDLDVAIEEIESRTKSSSKTSKEEFPTLGEMLQRQPEGSSTNLEKFHLDIRQNELYPENSTLVDKVIRDMASQPIWKVDQKAGGTQIKLTIHYENQCSALFKPMRFPREQQTLPNHIYFADYERHTAEIATFHLDRILGFRRAMPVTGRTLNMTSEIYDIANEELRKTFFVSPAPDNNKCFFGDCERYCDLSHPVCGNSDMIEGSFVAFFPDVKNEHWSHPWRRAYNRVNKAIWEDDRNYCDKVTEKYPYKEGRLILDLMDMAVLDFLTGNMDRHNFLTIKIFGINTFAIHYDHGRGFGRPFYDELSALAPLLQCCFIRSSTLKTLLRFHNGPKPLSALMREAMSIDPVAPVLWEPHLEALDRRVDTILNSVRGCIKKNSIDDVLITYDEIKFD